MRKICLGLDLAYYVSVVLYVVLSCLGGGDISLDSTSPVHHQPHPPDSNPLWTAPSPMDISPPKTAPPLDSTIPATKETIHIISFEPISNKPALKSIH